MVPSHRRSNDARNANSTSGPIGASGRTHVGSMGRGAPRVSSRSGQLCDRSAVSSADRRVAVTASSPDRLRPAMAPRPETARPPVGESPFQGDSQSAFKTSSSATQGRSLGLGRRLGPLPSSPTASRSPGGLPPGSSARRGCREVSALRRPCPSLGRSTAIGAPPR